ncbi:MAG: chemotaxis protein [Burkholderiales bacterium RIFCSPLOWO2_02_FULL_57_36]|nr:MAG: chemotaxis protein [Burkholderiales bacterium RIFCSPLOWO2_02_FULL_57_36]
MTTEALLRVQLRRLLSGLSDHGHQHLTEVETDLAQTTILLSEAIEKLGASFMAIHKAVSAQQEAVDKLLTAASTTPEVAEQLRSMQGEIDTHVNSAVTGLQFQDMTSQLIGRTVRRVTGLRDVLGVVGSSGSGVLPESDTEQIADLLERINKLLDEQSGKLESRLWKQVSQTHMNSGEIELF